MSFMGRKKQIWVTEGWISSSEEAVQASPFLWTIKGDFGTIIPYNTSIIEGCMLASWQHWHFWKLCKTDPCVFHSDDFLKYSRQELNGVAKAQLCWPYECGSHPGSLSSFTSAVENPTPTKPFWPLFSTCKVVTECHPDGRKWGKMVFQFNWLGVSIQ